MTTPGQGNRAEHEQPGHDTHLPEASDQPHQGKHGWMMIACCIPMLAIAGALLAAGVVSVGFLVFAVACTVMMALMMRGMDHGGDKH